jgi:hypothetical protein
MDPIDLGILVTMIGPIYIALFNINQKIGKFDSLCRQFDTLAAEHAAMMGRERRQR